MKIIFFIHLMFAFLVGHIASTKNRNALGWGIFGFFMSLVALILILVSPAYCEKCKKPTKKKNGEHVCKNNF